MKLLVSIHDVAPPFQAEVEELWSCCRSLDIVPALLVVPRWHGQWPLADAPRTLAWVRARAREGASVMLHGDRHDEEGLPRSVADWFAAVGRTNREGEFLTLDAHRAKARLARGLAALRELGIDPIGFVAPSWLARPGLPRLVRDAGLALTEDTGAIWRTQLIQRLRSPVIRWSGRSLVRAHGSRLVATWCMRDTSPLLRVALHPTDLHSTVTHQSLRDVLARLREARTPLNYSTLAAQEDLVCAA